MTSPGTMLEVDDVIMDPTRHYRRPADVLVALSFTHDDKRRILESWALDADLIDDAESENMRGTGGDRSCLREARLALLQLDG